jgi:hypothetical protein
MSDLKDKIREEMTAERQSAQHLRKTMETRAEAELIQPPTGLAEDAREAATSQRLQADHLRETMEERAEEEIGN